MNASLFKRGFLNVYEIVKCQTCLMLSEKYHQEEEMIKLPHSDKIKIINGNVVAPS